jgi:hypothetical protein
MKRTRKRRRKLNHHQDPMMTMTMRKAMARLRYRR